MEELRIGLVGTGAIGRTHIERINNTLQGGKVVACADANIDFCKSVAEKYGIKAYEKGEDMIASDEIDAVVVTTLDPFHEQYVMAADQGRQVRFSARSRWLLRLMPASASLRLRWQPASSWFRLASCAAMIRVTAS